MIMEKKTFLKYSIHFITKMIPTLQEETFGQKLRKIIFQNGKRNNYLNGLTQSLFPQIIYFITLILMVLAGLVSQLQFLMMVLMKMNLKKLKFF